MFNNSYNMPKMFTPSEQRGMIEECRFIPNKVSWSHGFDSYSYYDKHGRLHLVSPIRQYNPHEGDYYTVLDEVVLGENARVMPRTYGKYASYRGFAIDCSMISMV